MARAQRDYVCQQCGGAHLQWSGQCGHCGAWNSLVEETRERTPGSGARQKKKASPIEMHELASVTSPVPRLKTGIAEYDRVLGGGLVAGSAVLLGGEPGIGKSTLLLQIAAHMGKEVAYFSGEESIDQIRMRATRLGLEPSKLGYISLATATNANDIVAELEARKPKLAIIDSIQTMYLPGIESAPGTVSQVRAAAYELIRTAKKNEIALLLVGHVTKDGAIAGPKVLEHMVDTVLQFEGDKGHQFRILRGIKNRFGATDEIGVFEMTGSGLNEVANPSATFLADRREDVSGAVVFAGMEGTRPLLVEIQALVSHTSMAIPRRNVVGWDNNRLAMLVAVLESRTGRSFAGYDIFLNVAGGVKISEPAADLAVAAALISALTDKPCPKQTVIFGEVGLSSEIRQIPFPELRLKEADKLGFKNAIMPNLKKNQPQKTNLKLNMVANLNEMIEILNNTR